MTINARIKAAGRAAKAGLILLAGLAANLGGSPVWAVPAGSPWGANYFPNVELVDQDGHTVRFYDDLIKDKVFAINFIYTRCTASCPIETAALRKVAKALGERMGRDIFFYTISIDGNRDNPQVLKEYASRFNTGPGWTFLTGRKEDVTRIREKLGMYREDGKPEKELGEHSIVILMGNERGGQWIKRSPFDNPEALARILDTRMLARRGTSGKSEVTAHAAAVMPASPGEELFQSQCANCHSLGADDNLGPGLAGVVQRRDRGWLKRWLKEPDRMIAGKDPTALALYDQYRQVPMPNLKLSDREIDTLIALMEQHP
ncbi:SCO family protein [Methylotetracoccus oryzae]|uniref:SCO family protein n=1 Tax=Methylotetracoccus oryzae TaxID=1919059 RepID=UPI0013A575EA|nr:SCO family protein [Methylotetracoccus oryzae]